MADFVIGDYKYFIIDIDAVQASADIRTKSSYEDIPSSVTYGGVTYRVINLHSCFSGCTNLTTSPTLPDTIENMHACFYGCTSLTTPPVIPNSVEYLVDCFINCTTLTTAPVIPSAVISMIDCFRGCTALEGDVYVYASNMSGGAVSGCFKDTIQPIVLHSMNNNTETCDLLAATANNGNVLVNVHPETPITFTDTEMNYKTDSGFIPVSLQTNANLVQCEIPDLVNGGTITTNVNDALLDLYERRPFTISWDIPIGTTVTISAGFTISNDNGKIKAIKTSTSNGGTYSICSYYINTDGTYLLKGLDGRVVTADPIFTLDGVNGALSPSPKSNERTYVVEKGDVISIAFLFAVTGTTGDNGVSFTPQLQRIVGGGV